MKGAPKYGVRKNGFFLLTPIEQVTSSGLRIKLELESATVAGKSVVAQERLF